MRRAPLVPFLRAPASPAAAADGAASPVAALLAARVRARASRAGCAGSFAFAVGGRWGCPAGSPCSLPALLDAGACTCAHMTSDENNNASAACWASSGTCVNQLVSTAANQEVS